MAATRRRPAIAEIDRAIHARKKPALADIVTAPRARRGELGPHGPSPAENQMTLRPFCTVLGSRARERNRRRCGGSWRVSGRVHPGGDRRRLSRRHDPRGARRVSGDRERPIRSAHLDRQPAADRQGGRGRRGGQGPPRRRTGPSRQGSMRRLRPAGRPGRSRRRSAPTSSRASRSAASSWRTSRATASRPAS